MSKRTIPCLWPGATIACIATGPSLTQHDCDAVRAAGLPTIAINDGHRLAPWADVLFSADRRWWPFHVGVPAFKGLKYGVGSSVGKANPFGPTKNLRGQVHPGYPDIQVVKNCGYDGLELSPIGVKTGRNSGYAAVGMAVHFGAKRILLLGYNMSYPNGKAHFFGDHPSGLSQNQGLYPGFRRRFDTMVEPLKALGIEVINCTPNTSLTTFPIRDLREVLSASLAVAS